MKKDFLNKILALLLLMSLCSSLSFANKKVAVVGGLWPLPALLAFFSDANLIYIPIASKNAIDNSLAAEIYPNLLKVPAGDNDNLESLLALKADLYICHKSNQKVCSILKRSNVNLIELSVNIDNYNSKKTLEHWLNSLSKEFNIQAKSKELIDRVTQVEEEIVHKTQGAKKPKAMIIQVLNDHQIIVGGLFGDYLLEKSGASNVFKGIKGNRNVNIEEILALNPEIIYITNFTPTMPEDLLNAKEWQGIEAIKTKQVYKFPLATYRPFAPSLDLPVILQYLAQKNHPKLFENLDIKQEFSSHFKRFYNIELNQKQLEEIMHPKREAGRLK